MKKLLSLIPLFALIIAGCSTTDTADSKPKDSASASKEAVKRSPIVGSWTAIPEDKSDSTKAEFDFTKDGKYTMSIFPENSEIKIQGTYSLADKDLKLNPESVELLNLPQEAAANKADIEKSMLEDLKKETEPNKFESTGDKTAKLNTGKNGVLLLTRK
ncbi:hypothetical protein CCB80_08275 [Armatimonadetes bacterium Uphvl-Ar1]|nr:hypothetical protein CCB80_08275 [Armatimonadetes bacterium Uphvl-Ar1]